MHVREIPPLIFSEFANERYTYDLQDFVQRRQVSYARHPGECEGSSTVARAADDCWLRLDDADSHITTLSLHLSLDGAVLDPAFKAIGSLVAGRRDTGTWSYGAGYEHEETVWVALNDGNYSADQSSEEGRPALTLAAMFARELPRLPNEETIEKLCVALSLLGKIGVRAQEMLDTGPFERSRYFARDINTERDMTDF